MNIVDKYPDRTSAVSTPITGTTALGRLRQSLTDVSTTIGGATISTSMLTASRITDVNDELRANQATTNREIGFLRERVQALEDENYRLRWIRERETIELNEATRMMSQMDTRLMAAQNQINELLRYIDLRA